MNSVNVNLESRSVRDIFRVATVSLELAERAEEKWEIEHHSIVGITFVAFAIEAMINHFGKIYFSDFQNIQSKF